MVSRPTPGAVAGVRRVEDCPYRGAATRGPEGDIARCRLVEGPFGEDCGPIPVPLAACEVCSTIAPPSPERPNEVVASFLFAHAERLLAGGCTGCDAERAEGVRARAVSELAITWTIPNQPGWAGQVPGLRAAVDVIDFAIASDTFAAHVLDLEPFAYLRYGDGEWLSILGQSGRTSDGQAFASSTLGLELRWSLEYAAGLWPDNERFHMGLHGGYYQAAICRLLVERRLTHRVHWVGDNLFAMGLNNLSTLRFLLAVRGFHGTKLLVANDALAPIARGLECRHIIVPRVDSHLELDRIEARCRSFEPSLVLCCAGMTSEPLLCRLHRANPAGIYVDCGSIFDVLVGRLSRAYTQQNEDGVLATLAEHYAPMLLGGAEGCAG